VPSAKRLSEDASDEVVRAQPKSGSSSKEKDTHT